MYGKDALEIKFLVTVAASKVEHNSVFFLFSLFYENSVINKKANCDYIFMVCIFYFFIFDPYIIHNGWCLNNMVI